jgi:hypothetical protein
MATIRFRNDKWQVQVRRLGYQARTQSFLNKTDAQRWARHIETELDRTLIPNDVRTLAKVTLAELLIRYRDTVTITKRGLLPETKRIEVFLRQDWTAYPLAKLNSHYFSAYRDDRLKCVGPGTVIRELGLLRSIFETARREWGYSALANPLAYEDGSALSLITMCVAKRGWFREKPMLVLSIVELDHNTRAVQVYFKELIAIPVDETDVPFTLRYSSMIKAMLVTHAKVSNMGKLVNLRRRKAR